ncbi:MAG TPA: DUF4129 domain-containing protein [Candidatus Dormibacteraeota bacterium]|nr:DUF4129 domain-containing protein [Candidatus Dormibacteraeota bacterium]
MRLLCAGVAAAIITVPLVYGSATPARAAACPALAYQAGLAAAATELEAVPAGVATARSEVTGLLGADPSRGLALQPVIDDLSAAPPQLDDARMRLEAMSATLAYPPNSTCNYDGTAARNTLHDVYASPDFKHLDDSNQPGFIDAILNFLGNLFGRAAGALGVAGGIAVALAALGLAALLAWRRWHGSAASRGTRIDEPAAAGDDPEAEWRAAERAAAAGDHREAIRRAFRSALIEVALRSRVHLDAAWTTRELLARCDAAGDVLVALAAAASLFERAWYGGRAVTAADWDVAAERCATVRRLARRQGVARA